MTESKKELEDEEVQDDDKVDPKKAIKKEDDEQLTLWKVIAPVNKEIYAGMVLSALSGVVWIASVVLLAPIAHEMVEHSDGSYTRESKLVVMRWALGVLCCIPLAIVMRMLSFKYSHLGGFKLEELLRTQLSEHLAKIPLGYVVTTGSGTLKKVLMDDVKSLHGFVADSTPLLARTFVMFPATLLAMIYLDWRMALLSLAVFPIGIVAMHLCFSDYDECQNAMDKAQEKMNNTIIEYVQGMQVVRTFDDGTASFGRYRTALDDASVQLKEWIDKTKYSGFIARMLFAALPTMAVLVIAGTHMIQNEKLDFVTFIVFLCLGPTLADSIVPVVWMATLIRMSSAGARRIGTLLNVPELPEARDPKLPSHAGVSFENVTFTYDNRTEPALRNVSMTMKEGTVTALVGPSGAGKSTVTRLIPRFWDIESGTIRVGGVDIREIATDQLMKHVSFVFQQPFLLHDTIYQNILLGNPGANRAQVEEAAKTAQAHDFITELPQGYDTRAGDRGTRLSGGQRQRITIARAILQDSPIVVLDEATAFADPENEANIHAAIARLTKGKTLIVVAHRLSTIRGADQIVVLNKGRVAEVGTHDDLAARKSGIYANLWAKFNEAQGWGLRRTTMGTKD